MEKRDIRSRQDLIDAFKMIEPYLAEHGQIKLQWDKGGRSLDQNALFHMWCEEFAHFLTMQGRESNKDEVKYWFKSKFLGFMDLKVGRDIIPAQLRETKRLTVGEMYHFMEQVWEYCSSTFGCYLTVPDNSQFKKNRDKQND